MSKRMLTVLLTALMILAPAAGGKSMEVHAANEEVMVSAQNVGGELVIDTGSDYGSSYTASIRTAGKYPVYFSQTRFFNGNGGVVWSSDNPAIAVVSIFGEVTAVNEGETTIRCFDVNHVQTACYNIYCTTRNDGHDPCTYSTFDDNKNTIYEYIEYHSPEEVQARVSTIVDVFKFILLNQYNYDFEAPILAGYDYTWAMDAETFMTNRGGVCCDVANLGAYLLQYDYEELGFIYHFGQQIGHVYNYVYEDGYYYIFDLTDVISLNYRSYDYFQIHKVKNLSDFVPYILAHKTDSDRLLGIVAVNSLNHTEQPSNYMSYIHDDSVIFHEKVYTGFEEGVPFEVLYVNPKAAGLVEFISIPHDQVPRQVPSWFRNEIADRQQWNLY